MRKIVFVMVMALMCSQSIGKAEAWLTLEDYVARCVLIVKAKTFVEKDGVLSFQVLESWKGESNPKLFLHTTPDGRFFPGPFEHGLVNVVNGQDVVFFFTRESQGTDGRILHHSTALPVRDGKVVYALTSRTLSQTFTLEEFKDKIQGQVADEDTLVKMINALSVGQLSILKGRVDKRLEELINVEKNR